jgi:hypothetical protein
MLKSRLLSLFILISFVFAFGSSDLYAQKKKRHAKSAPRGEAVLWEPVRIEDRDLFLGPGGAEMQPDLSNITFIEQEKSGHNKKNRIKDGSGRVWVAKLGTEAQPETVAVRLLWALGYKTEINYLVPSMTIPTKGTFKNVRLEARPENVKRLDEWKWKDNPFLGTNQLQGLKIMQVFMTNYDLLDLQNKILQVDKGGRPELDYVISDLGSTFGKFGNNNLPIFFRFGRKANSPRSWAKGKFIKGVKGDHLQFATTGSKNRSLMKNITLAQGRWLADLLLRLDDRQLTDAFRAANYSPTDADILLKAAKRRIGELDRYSGVRLAGNEK